MGGKTESATGSEWLAERGLFGGETPRFEGEVGVKS